MSFVIVVPLSNTAFYYELLGRTDFQLELHITHTFYVIETPKPTNQAKLCTLQNKRPFSITKWGDECFMNFRSKPCFN